MLASLSYILIKDCDLVLKGGRVPASPTFFKQKVYGTIFDGKWALNAHAKAYSFTNREVNIQSHNLWGTKEDQKLICEIY